MFNSNKANRCNTSLVQRKGRNNFDNDKEKSKKNLYKISNTYFFKINKQNIGLNLLFLQTNFEEQ